MRELEKRINNIKAARNWSENRLREALDLLDECRLQENHRSPDFWDKVNTLESKCKRVYRTVKK